MSMIFYSSREFQEHPEGSESVEAVVKILPMEGFEGLHIGSAAAAAVDIRATETLDLEPGSMVKMSALFKMEIPRGYAALIYPRSGLGSKGLVIKNLVGVVDSDYRGEVFLTLDNTSSEPFPIRKGDRVCQMIIHRIPSVHYQTVEALSETARGVGGFGSTGV